MASERIQYTEAYFREHGMPFKQTYSASTTANVQVLPLHMQPDSVKQMYAAQGWQENEADLPPLPRGTIGGPAHDSDMPQRSAATNAALDAQATDSRNRGLELTKQFRQGLEAIKPPMEARRPAAIPSRAVQDSAKEEACREYAGRLLAESGGKLTVEQAWIMAERVWEESGGLMDKQPGKPGSPEERLSKIERELDDMAAPGRQEHERRAEAYAKALHRQSKSPSWAQCLDATRPKHYSSRKPTDREVADYATRQISAGRRISFAEAEHELCGA